MDYIIRLYSLINIFLEKLGFKLDYIGSRRYQWMKDFDIKNLIDVGANKGQTIKKYKKIWNNSLEIYAFEPLQGAFGLLQAQFENDKKINLYNMGLGSKQETKEIHLYTHDDSSSFLESSKEGKEIYNYAIAKSETIIIDTLDNMFQDKKLYGNTMMKIDVQGFELPVLKGGEKFIESVKIIILELSFIELYTGQELFDEIYNWLIERGFSYAGSLEQAGHTHNGKPLQQDTIFINKKL